MTAAHGAESREHQRAARPWSPPPNERLDRAAVPVLRAGPARRQLLRGVQRSGEPGCGRWPALPAGAEPGGGTPAGIGVVVVAGGTAVTADAARRPGTTCQACGSGPIDADGYCESCGTKAPSGRDHEETDLVLLAGVTDRGLRHFRNEDAMALGATEAAGSPVAIAVVCDGVSSSGRPDEASLAAAKAARGVLLAAAEDGQDVAEASARAAQAAQQALAGLPGSTPPAKHHRRRSSLPW